MNMRCSFFVLTVLGVDLCGCAARETTMSFDPMSRPFVAHRPQPMDHIEIYYGVAPSRRWRAIGNLYASCPGQLWYDGTQNMWALKKLAAESGADAVVVTPRVNHSWCFDGLALVWSNE